jgi:hypothetical protein
MPNPPTEGNIPVDNVGQLLQNALEDGGIVGVDEDIEQIVLTKAFRHANWILDDWVRRRWLNYSLTEYSFVATGVQTYNVGRGQTINISPRPDRLEYAFLRLVNAPGPPLFPVDIPLDIIPSKEDYSRITVKSIGSFPWRIFYDPQWPVGVLYPWPVPITSLYEIHVGYKTVLPRFMSLNDPINFPPEYESAMNWELARRMRAAFSLPAVPEITQLARTTLNTIRLANQAMPTLRMPSFLRARQRAYSYQSDQ